MNIRDQNEFMAGQPISARALNELARQVQENTLTVAAPLTMTRSPYGTALAIGSSETLPKIESENKNYESSPASTTVILTSNLVTMWENTGILTMLEISGKGTYLIIGGVEISVSVPFNGYADTKDPLGFDLSCSNFGQYGAALTGHLAQPVNYFCNACFSQILSFPDGISYPVSVAIRVQVSTATNPAGKQATFTNFAAVKLTG